MKKGHAAFVGIFHLSFLGIEDNVGDLDIIVNGGKIQPSCKKQMTYDLCNHYVANCLHTHLVRRITNETERDGFSSGIHRLNGIPIIHANENCKANNCSTTESFEIVLTRPPGHRGVHYMTTAPLYFPKSDDPKDETKVSKLSKLKFW